MKILWFFSLQMLLYADFFSFQTIEKAQQAYKDGQFLKSAMLFKGVENDDPSVAYDVASAFYKAGKYDEALSYYDKAQGINPQRLEHNRGNCFFQKKEYDKAIKAYEKALKNGEDVETRYNLSLAKKQRNKKRQEEKKKKEQKKKEKKKHDKNKKKEENQKKREEEKKKQEEKKKREAKEKEEKQKRQKEQKKSQKQSDKEGEQKRQKAKKKMSSEEKMRKKELSHLMKQLSQKKMPTLMYEATEQQGGASNEKPW